MECQRRVAGIARPRLLASLRQQRDERAPCDGKGSDSRRKDLHSLQCAADDFREAADGETESRGVVRPLRHDSATDLQEPERPIASLPAEDRQPFRECGARGRQGIGAVRARHQSDGNPRAADHFRVERAVVRGEQQRRTACLSRKRESGGLCQTLRHDDQARGGVGRNGIDSGAVVSESGSHYRREPQLRGRPACGYAEKHQSVFHPRPDGDTPQEEQHHQFRGCHETQTGQHGKAAGHRLQPPFDFRCHNERHQPATQLGAESH